MQDNNTAPEKPIIWLCVTDLAVNLVYYVRITLQDVW